MSVNTFPLEIFDFGVSLSGIICIPHKNDAKCKNYNFTQNLLGPFLKNITVYSY